MVTKLLIMKFKSTSYALLNLRQTGIFIYSIFALMFFVISCNSKNKIVANNFIQKEIDTINDEPLPLIFSVMGKMRKQEKLTNSDYACICNFLLNNTDEGDMESIGYDLFKCLKKNQLYNSSFLSYLNKKRSSYKEKVLYKLVISLGVDLKIENYSYDAFIEDFEMFKNSVSAKKCFEEGMRIDYEDNEE